MIEFDMLSWELGVDHLLCLPHRVVVLAADLGECAFHGDAGNRELGGALLRLDFLEEVLRNVRPGWGTPRTRPSS